MGVFHRGFQTLPGEQFFMPMFLQLADGVELTESLEKKISAELRKQCSPRHVPDKYYAIEESRCH